jgi:hypothetical protein
MPKIKSNNHMEKSKKIDKEVDRANRRLHNQKITLIGIAAFILVGFTAFLSGFLERVGLVVVVVIAAELALFLCWALPRYED